MGGSCQAVPPSPEGDLEDADVAGGERGGRGEGEGGGVRRGGPGANPELLA